LKTRFWIRRAFPIDDLPGRPEAIRRLVEQALAKSRCRKREVVAQLTDDVLSKLTGAFFDVCKFERWTKRDLSSISGIAYCGAAPDPTTGIPPLVTIVTGRPRPLAAMTTGKPYALVPETSRTGTFPLATITTTRAISHSNFNFKPLAATCVSVHRDLAEGSERRLHPAPLDGFAKKC
jgi:hypothetical protein